MTEMLRFFHNSRTPTTTSHFLGLYAGRCETFVGRVVLNPLSSSRRQLLEQSVCNGLGNAFPTAATLPLGATFVIVTGWFESAA